ncbi:brain protein I3 [Contarinia nasturtii]|uniref:brain protein I3 n=1 Tax=Contarinia nasturtii TaxID=265458 RepID=UPI0012D45A60|nr:brain protein I3 [Contarinia nasturtii]
MYQDQPPSYNEAINSPITPSAPPVGSGMVQSSIAVPSGSYMPNYPIQPLPQVQPEVITKPIRPLPTIPTNTSYGTLGQATIAVPTEIIVINGCPACRIGILEDDYTCLGICCAIFCFPLGILCCLALKSKRCTNCGAEF